MCDRCAEEPDDRVADELLHDSAARLAQLFQRLALRPQARAHLDGLADVGIDVIACRHEQAVVLAAEAYARVTGRPGVATVTAGPGVTNAVTGLAVANSSGSPVMLLAGKTSTAKRHTGTFQD